MKYKGVEVKEVTEPQLFNPPKRMLVWDKDNELPFTDKVCAIVNRKYSPVITENAPWRHCAEIPESKPKSVTFRELACWLAKGNGEVNCSNTVCSRWNYSIDNEQEFLSEKFSVRKWDDNDWHNPTREYLGLEDK